VINKGDIICAERWVSRIRFENHCSNIHSDGNKQKKKHRFNDFTI